MSSPRWLSEMDMEDPSRSFLHQYQIDTFDYSIDDLHFQSLSPESYSSYPNHYVAPKPNIIEASSVLERPLEQRVKTEGWTSPCPSHGMPQHITIPKGSPSVSSPQLISFASLDSFHKTPKVEVGSVHDEYPAIMYQARPSYEGTRRSVTGAPTRSPLHAQDHVIAERKRREKLSQRFISLSAVVPGLKKTDKASVLGETIKYLKHLQQSVKTLEEKTAKKTIESAVFVNKSQLPPDDETSSCDENFTSRSSQPLPEIEARLSDKDVLIKVHCEKQKGCAVKILNEVDKLHLTPINCTVLPFGKSILDITIVAKMEDGIYMSAKDLARNLRAALLKLI